MTPEEAKLVGLFTPHQFKQLTETADLICGPWTDKFAHATIRKLFYNALLASFQVGRVTGIKELADTLTSHFPPEIQQAIRGIVHPGGDKVQ